MTSAAPPAEHALTPEALPARRRVRRTALVSAVLVGLVAIALVALLATRGTPPGTVSASPLLGKPAPALVGSDIATGHSLSLSSMRGHYVVVNFFASWCTPCSTETPQLVAFLYAERKIGVRALGVVFDDSASNARAFLRREGASWPAVTDPNGALAAAYGVPDPPESFLIAPSGRVLAKITGGLTEETLLASLQTTSGDVG